MRIFASLRIAGRALRQAHYEMIADQSLNLPLGSSIRLGKDVYQVVGLTRGMVGTGMTRRSGNSTVVLFLMGYSQMGGSDVMGDG